MDRKQYLHDFYRSPKEKAKAIYRAQVARCTNPKSKQYPWWGARGIRVEYAMDEFVAWYLREIGRANWKSPSCGRIDHSKNYCFENIKMQERSENCRERIERAGRPARECPVIRVGRDGAPDVTYSSIKEAQAAMGLRNISRACRKGIKDGGFFWRHAHGGAPSRSHNFKP